MIDFSIVTICYNAVQDIEKTVLSVLSQTYKNYEYIIIDGASTDGTIELIRECINKYNKNNIHMTIVSEKDNGIYNAMNKGVNLASGKYINFMNSGDAFCNKDILKNLSSNMLTEDVIYGNTVLVDQKNNMAKHRTPDDIDSLVYKMPFFHQSVFVKSELMKKYMFDEKYKLCSDHNFFIKVMMNNNSFRYINVDVSNYKLDGVSSDWYKVTKERMLVLYDNNLISKNKYRIKLFILKNKKIISKMIPHSIVEMRNKKRQNKEYKLSQGWYLIDGDEK